MNSEKCYSRSLRKDNNSQQHETSLRSAIHTFHTSSILRNSQGTNESVASSETDVASGPCSFVSPAVSWSALWAGRYITDSAAPALDEQAADVDDEPSPALVLAPVTPVDVKYVITTIIIMMTPVTPVDIKYIVITITIIIMAPVTDSSRVEPDRFSAPFVETGSPSE